MKRGEKLKLSARVPSRRRAATFLVTGQFKRHQVTFVAPSGTRHAAKAANKTPGMQYKNGRTWAMFEVANPRAGAWHVEINATGVPRGKKDTACARLTVDGTGGGPPSEDDAPERDIED